MNRVPAFAMAAAACACLALAACSPAPKASVQGYVEGEFVNIASPRAGAMNKVFVRRGQQAETGAPLFELDSVPERAARDEAERRLVQARATFDDEKKGLRPEEIAALEAQLEQARSALDLSSKEFVRQQQLSRSGAAAVQEMDRARSARDQDQQRVARLDADLKTARLGARSDRVAAAEANVQALEAALVRADWELRQKRQAAPQAGLVFDVLYREGEWVPAGRPAVVLLPPGNVKVRAFVPETRIGGIRPGDPARVTADGASGVFEGEVSFISPRAEYTPPVIYSRETRAKLVFMVEIVFGPETGAKLHPGQPVDVEIYGR